jgi:lipopolysaccharide biosynthesis regulator YciM
LLRARARSRLDLANRKIQDDLLLALEQDAAHGQATLLLTRHLTERAKEEGEEQLLTEVVDRLEKLAQATNGAVALAARCDLAVAYQLRHMDTEANESLECLEAERPTPGSVHLARAEVYELQEEFDKADEELILAIAASPASIRAHVARARLWSDGSNCSRAFYHWARAYDLGLRTWELHDNLAREARSTRDWRLAIDHASRALAIRRDLIASLWARGKARNRLGLYEESIEDLNAFLGLEPNGKRAKEAEGLIAAAQLAGSR